MAREIEKTKTVDFVPEMGIDGDFKKITEYDFAAFNSRILPVLTLCLMEKGSNQLIPNMGAKNIFMQIPFSIRIEVSGYLEQIKKQFSTYLTGEVNISIDEDKSNWDEGEITLAIDISGVPGKLSLSVNKNSNDYQPFKISHPSLFQKNK